MLLRRIYTILLLGAALILPAACDNNDTMQELSTDEVYFFYQETCPHCHDAAQYIKNKYPRLKIISRDIKLPGNMELFRQAVADYNITGVAGTPLICFGDKYIMGWGEEDKFLFDAYIIPYLP